MVDGRIPLPTAPGLGIELDFEAIASIPMEPRELLPLDTRVVV